LHNNSFVAAKYKKGKRDFLPVLHQGSALEAFILMAKSYTRFFQDSIALFAT